MEYETICKYCGNAFTFIGIDKTRLPRGNKICDMIECPRCGKELYDAEPCFYPWRKVDKKECK